MSRKYFVIEKTDHWTTHAEQVHKEGIGYERSEDMPIEQQTVNVAQPDGSVVTKSRQRRQDVSMGIESQDAHYMGDRVVITHEEADPKTGDVKMYFDRYSDSGKRTGSYVVPWLKVADGTHRKGTPRRIFT